MVKIRLLILIGCVVALMGRAEIQSTEELLTLLRSNYVDAQALDATLLNEALIVGLKKKMERGFEVSSESLSQSPSFFQSFQERNIVFNQHSFLLLQFFNDKKFERNTKDYRNRLMSRLKTQSLAGIVIDVRGWKDLFHYDELAQFLSFWVSKNSSLFGLAAWDQTEKFYQSQEESVNGAIPIVVILNEDTRGVGEVVAESLRRNKRAVIVGTQSAGMAVQVSEWMGARDSFYRIPTRRVVFADQEMPFSGKVDADVKVAIDLDKERVILQQEAASDDLTAFIFDEEKEVKNNEVALVEKKGVAQEESVLAQPSEEKKQASDMALRTGLDILLGSQLLKKM
ncbi:MAG: S41 family peptidase [Verrucomicrobiia bacterium]